MKTTWPLIRSIASMVLLLCIMLFGMGQSGGGCATMMNELSSNPAIYYGAARSSAADGDFAKANAYSTLGDMYAWSGQRSHEVQVAREGRSQVNVNVNHGGSGHSQQQPPNTVRSSDGRLSPAPGYKWVTDAPRDFRTIPVPPVPHVVRKVFSCNYWRDFNANGITEMDEFVGIKSRFRRGERIILVYVIEPANMQDTIRWQIISPSGKELAAGTNRNPGGGGGFSGRVGDNPPDYDLIKWLFEQAGYGHYRFAAYLNGQFVGSTEFELYE